jgi:hypothetical protein
MTTRGRSLPRSAIYGRRLAHSRWHLNVGCRSESGHYSDDVPWDCFGSIRDSRAWGRMVLAGGYRKNERRVEIEFRDLSERGHNQPIEHSV